MRKPATTRGENLVLSKLLEKFLKEASPKTIFAYDTRDPKSVPCRQDLDRLEPDALVTLLVMAGQHADSAFAIRANQRNLATSTPASQGQAAVWALLAYCLKPSLACSSEALDPLLAWSGTTKSWAFKRSAVEGTLLAMLEHKAKRQGLTPQQHQWLESMIERWSAEHKGNHARIGRARALAGKAESLDLEPGEAWSDAAIATIKSAPAKQKTCWIQLVAHCKIAAGSAPSAKWLAAGQETLKSLGAPMFRKSLVEWFPLVDEQRTVERPRRHQYEPEWTNRIIDAHMEVLKGLCWLVSTIPDPHLARALGRLAISAYRKVPGVGPRAVKVGNAAVYALGQMPGRDALGQLAMLRVKVKFGTAQKGIEKALTAAAAREGLPRDEIDELGVPSYGLTEVGKRREPMGNFTAELIITGIGKTELRFVKNDGGPDASADIKPAKAGRLAKPGKTATRAPKPQKSIPAALKESHAEELKDLKSAAKDIAAMLPAQRDRIDSLFLENKTWPLAAWRERYLDHPLIGVLARRLIWRIGDGTNWTSVTWLEEANGLVGVDGRTVLPGGPGSDRSAAPAEETARKGGSTVRLWHPIEVPAEEVLAWRRFFEDRQIRQPFKQAHREVYLLTDAERNTETYSNRFAAHILRQHQFHALAAVRNWKNRLRLMVDDEYPPATRALPAWGLRAEYWIEGAGHEYGQDTNEAGAFLHLVTDQVRFYLDDAAQATAHAGGGGYGSWRAEVLAAGLRLERVPPLVFSEIMRDVDLFVGVASVGNNPQWNDGGPNGAHRDYWQAYSFGDLSQTGAGRRDLLERLLPRLKIAPVCSLSEKFLIVKGRIRTYKIHLGSGNILMEPNNQYLCIVPGRGDATTASGEKAVFLPFEGDRTLAIILSKAFMLAEDDKIKDPSITRQVRG